MYYLAPTGCSVFFQWIIIFILFLSEFLFYLKNIVNRKNLINGGSNSPTLASKS